METIRMKYIGGLRTCSTHVKSGTELITDAPVDNNGKGEQFSPTDLVANALGSCMLTIMGIAAENHNFNIDGAESKITKIMSSDPRKIAEIKIELQFPNNNYTAKEKRLIEHIVKTCPVALSLHPDLKQTVTVQY
jgi:putative redox protein